MLTITFDTDMDEARPLPAVTREDFAETVSKVAKNEATLNEAVVKLEATQEDIIDLEKDLHSVKTLHGYTKEEHAETVSKLAKTEAKLNEIMAKLAETVLKLDETDKKLKRVERIVESELLWIGWTPLIEQESIEIKKV